MPETPEVFMEPKEETPLVTVVTPSYNSARYLEETVRSVLSQDYPNIEYIVLDADSTDGSQDILARYKDRLSMYIRPDTGTSDAIQSGFELSHGAVFTFLCADDTLLPGAVSAAVRALNAHPEVSGVYGDGWWVDETGNRLASYPTRPFERDLLMHECYICQPASFVRSEAVRAAGGYNRRLGYTYDYEFWLRLTRNANLLYIKEFLANSRMHRETKTLGRRHKVFRETMQVLKQQGGYVPFRWVYSYCCHMLDGRDQFFEPLRPSLGKYIVSLLVGSAHNSRRLLRYWREWFAVMSVEGLVRLWSASRLARALSGWRRD